MSEEVKESPEQKKFFETLGRAIWAVGQKITKGAKPLILPAFLGLGSYGVFDTTVGPHTMQKALKGTVAEVTSEPPQWLVPTLRKVDRMSSITSETNREVLLMKEAIRHMPGGAKAIKQAEEKRQDDSTMIARAKERWGYESPRRRDYAHSRPEQVSE